MPRKSTSRSGADTLDRTVVDGTHVSSSIPPSPWEERPGSSVSLEMVNVFGEAVAECAGTTPGACLRLTAWVNNVSYVKDVWVDAYLTDASGAVAHRETLVLDYREGAGGGGDFFVLDAPVLAQGTTTPVTRLQYRLYYQIGDTVYAEGILHEHELRSTPETAETTSEAVGPAAGQEPPKLTSLATSKDAASDTPVAKPRSKTKAAPKKTAAPAPNGAGGEAEAPAKRISRRRPS